MSTERKTLEERHQMSDIERLRHSCAHVLATAICRLWPDVQWKTGFTTTWISSTGSRPTISRGTKKR